MNYNEFNQLSTLTQINVINALGVFELECPVWLGKNQDELYDNLSLACKFAPSAILSKTSFKQVAENREGNIRNRFSGKTYFNTSDFSYGSSKLHTLLEVSLRTNKLGIEKLREMLQHRLSGIYKQKVADGMVWNQGGI